MNAGAQLTVSVLFSLGSQPVWDDIAYIYHVSLIVVNSRSSFHKRAQWFIS